MPDIPTPDTPTSDTPAPDCIFCRIVAGELPSDEVLSTDATYAFRDIKPALPVHVLVVPREHIVSADTVGPAHAGLLAEMMDTAQKVARREGLAERGYRLVFNVGDDAQNSVAHLHMHLVGGRPMEWPPG
jgi:histidine triad (HIT) family protein